MRAHLLWDFISSFQCLSNVWDHVGDNQENVGHNQLEKSKSNHGPSGSNLCVDVSLEVCEHELVIRDEQINSLVEDLELVDGLVEEWMEVHQVQHESQTEPNVNEDLHRHILRLREVEADENEYETTSDVHEIVVVGA